MALGVDLLITSQQRCRVPSHLCFCRWVAIAAFNIRTKVATFPLFVLSRKAQVETMVSAVHLLC